MMADKKQMTKKALLLVSVLALSGLGTVAVAQDAGFQPALPGDANPAAVESAPVETAGTEVVTGEASLDEMPTPPEPDPVATPAEQAAAPEIPGTPAVTAAARPGSSIIPVEAATLVAIAEAKSHMHDASVTPEAIKSLFFTAWQHALLQEAKIGFNTRLPNPGEMSAGESGARDPGIREISLGGIAFANGKKWAVWLNGVRITPDAIPEQVLDIKVSDAYIDLKWFDGYTNKIYPVRLRPHERFNLDTRIFLPGSGTL